MRRLIVNNIMSRDGYYEGFKGFWPKMANELVDELHLMIGPVVVGAGTPIFDGRPAGSLRLIDLRSWDGSENVLVRYEVGRSEV
jgi:riboflavin biosynthesis pyrimidine reductase